VFEFLDALSTTTIVIVIAVIVLGVSLVGVARRRGLRDRTTEERETPDAPSEDGEEDRGGATAVDTLPTVPDTPADLVEEAPPVAEPPTEAPPVEEVLPLGERFRRRLSKTRNVLGASVLDLFGRGIDDDAWEGLEEALITADVGVTATMEIVEELKRRSREEGAATAEAVLTLLKEELANVLGSADRSLARATDDGPTVWLVTGVNGTGKTTSIGKLAAVEQREDRTVVLAAADTFRAAAAEQLGIWAQRTGAHLVRKDEGADPASVAYEAYDAATGQDADLLIVDTAGRLQNKRELMDELGKVKRVLEKQAGPLEETLLVLDATTGQNGISQAQAFLDAVDITGIVLTKLDGSARGGIVVAVQRELGIPVKLVGLGEDIDDLAPFDPQLFVEGLFADVAR